MLSHRRGTRLCLHRGFTRTHASTHTSISPWGPWWRAKLSPACLSPSWYDNPDLLPPPGEPSTPLLNLPINASLTPRTPSPSLKRCASSKVTMSSGQLDAFDSRRLRNQLKLKLEAPHCQRFNQNVLSSFPSIKKKTFIDEEASSS